MKTTHAQAGATCTPEAPNPTAVIILLMAGTFLAPLDSSIVNIALPAIAEEFGAGLTQVSWVATAYLLANASLVLTMGRLGDIKGLKVVYVAGFFVFGAGSLACAVAWSLPALIAFRVLQAAGASMMFATGPALVMRTFAADRRGWALGWLSLSVSAGLMMGPVLGGLLLSAFDWRAVFLINLPFAVAVIIAARRMLPKDCPSAEPFDPFGALLAGGALLSLLLGMSWVDTYGLISLNALTAFGLAVTLGIVFVLVESRIEHPMVDLSLFTSRRFSAGIAAPVLTYMALFAVTFTLPFYLLSVRGLDPAAAGLVLTATPAAMALLAPAAGRLSDRIGSRGLATSGLVWMALTLAVMSLLSLETPVIVVAAALFSMGSGVSFFMTPNSAAVLRATPKHRVGVGSALIGEARSVGMALGIGVTAAIVSSGLGDSGLMDSTGILSNTDAQMFVVAMRPAFLTAAGLTLLAALVSWLRGPDAVESSRSVA